MPKGVPNKRYTPEFKEEVIKTMQEEGPEGLAIERRGRSSKGHSVKLPKNVEEDLLAEVQRLRAENEYLKNL